VPGFNPINSVDTPSFFATGDYQAILDNHMLPFFRTLRQMKLQRVKLRSFFSARSMRGRLAAQLAILKKRGIRGLESGR
jgi:hypothetical protein